MSSLIVWTILRGISRLCFWLWVIVCTLIFPPAPDSSRIIIVRWTCGPTAAERWHRIVLPELSCLTSMRAGVITLIEIWRWGNSPKFSFAALRWWTHRSISIHSQSYFLGNPAWFPKLRSAVRRCVWSILILIEGRPFAIWTISCRRRSWHHRDCPLETGIAIFRERLAIWSSLFRHSLIIIITGCSKQDRSTCFPGVLFTFLMNDSSIYDSWWITRIYW